MSCSSVMDSITGDQAASKEAITQAVMSDARKQASERDAFRHPQQTLEFFGLRDDMTVVEIWHLVVAGIHLLLTR
ncbi:hypothetical protein PN838_10690 [Psychrosphaera sp. G1-22]|uniref:Uncharacterized protein n=1 Tax=Psychrosphaera algicola TaxID=3023714 RepID=A0ABT5FDD3_9GAMM|nr:hypothetical protein [Psychrosphaera sp. G1-22]MDC2889144.1 hypothetical protein [Psychrosphaera sp. G1-22]